MLWGCWGWCGGVPRAGSFLRLYRSSSSSWILVSSVGFWCGGQASPAGHGGEGRWASDAVLCFNIALFRLPPAGRGGEGWRSGQGVLRRLFRGFSRLWRLALGLLGAAVSSAGLVEIGWCRRLAASTSWHWLGEASPLMRVHRRQIPVFGPDGYCGLQRSFAAMELRPASGVWWLRLPPLQDRSGGVGVGRRRAVRWQAPGKDRDLVVEPMSTTGSTQPSRPDVRSSPPASSESVRARNSGSSSRSAAPPPQAPQAGSATNPLRFDARTIHFSVNAWVLVVAGLGMLPILPKHLADRACKLSLLGTVLSSGYSLYSTYGKPRELNMAAIQGWLQSVLGAKDFIHLMFSLLLVTSQLHLRIAALPVFCWALDHVARFLRRNFARSSFYRGYLEEPCLWVETNNTTLSLLSSNAELALGFLLIISLFSWRRNIIQTFMYWNVLKLMYRAPVTSSYHQSAWAKIGRAVNPYIDRYAPFLQTPISMVQRWWLR